MVQLQRAFSVMLLSAIFVTVSGSTYQYYEPPTDTGPSEGSGPRPSLSRKPRPSASTSPSRSVRPSASQKPSRSSTSSPSRSCLNCAKSSQSRSPSSPPQSKRASPSPQQLVEETFEPRFTPPVENFDKQFKCGCKPVCTKCVENTDCESNVCIGGWCGSVTTKAIIKCLPKPRPLCAVCEDNADCASDNCVRNRCVTPLNKDRKKDPLWEEKRVQMEQLQSLACTKRRLTTRCGGCGNNNECKDLVCQSGFCAKTSRDFLLCAHQFSSSPKTQTTIDRMSTARQGQQRADSIDKFNSDITDNKVTEDMDVQDESFWDDGQEGAPFDWDKQDTGNAEEMESDEELGQDWTRRVVEEAVSRERFNKKFDRRSMEYTVEGASCARPDAVYKNEEGLNVEGASYVRMETGNRVVGGAVGDAAWDLNRDESDVKEGEWVKGDGSGVDNGQDEWSTVHTLDKEEGDNDEEEGDGDEEGYDVTDDQADVAAGEDLVVDDFDGDAQDDVQVSGMVSMSGFDDEVEGGFVDDIAEDALLREAMENVLG